MCKLTLVNQYANTYEYEEDCNQDEGVLHLVEGSDNGTHTEFAMSGNDTDGQPIDDSISVPNAEKVNPTKLFRFIADTLKEVLCPKCV